MLIVAILVPTLLLAFVLVDPFVQIAHNGTIMVSIAIMPVPALVYFVFFSLSCQCCI